MTGKVIFAFPKIVTNRFTHDRLTPRIVERVVNKLEGNSEIVPVIAHGLGLTHFGAGGIGARLGGCGKQSRGFGGDDVEVLHLTDRKIFSESRNCRTSPSAITAEALARMASTTGEPTSTIN